MPRCRWSLPAVLALLASVALAPVPASAAVPDNCDRCFALVRANGTIVRHRNLSANYRLATGRYQLNFKYPISNCALSANIDSLIVEDNTRLAWISLSRQSNKNVVVEIARPSGSSVATIDFPFSLTVTC